MAKEISPEARIAADTEERKDHGVIADFNPYLMSLLPFANITATSRPANYKQLAETVKKLEAWQAKVKTEWQEEKGNLEAEIAHLRQQVQGLKHLADKFEQLMHIVKCQEELFETEIATLKKQNLELTQLLSNKHGGDNIAMNLVGVDLVDIGAYYVVEPGAGGGGSD